MSDDRLRELERRFHETSTLEDEVQWLQERLRVGELGEPRLRLAAHLGHDASAAVLGQAVDRLEHPALEGIEGEKCGAGYPSCERYHSSSTGRMRHGPPVGWAGEMRCPDAKPGEGRYLRAGPEFRERISQALTEWLGDPAVNASTGSAELLQLTLGYDPPARGA